MGAEIANDELVKKQFGVYRMFQKCLLKDDASYVLGNIAVHKTIFISVETHDVSSRYEEDFDMAKLCPQDSSLGRYSAIETGGNRRRGRVVRANGMREIGGTRKMKSRVRAS